MVAGLRGSMGTGTEEDESSTGRVWDAGFHHSTALSRLARVLNLLIVYFFHFPNPPPGRDQPRLTETANAAVHLRGLEL